MRSRLIIVLTIQTVGAVRINFANIHSRPLPFLPAMVFLLPGDLIWMTGWRESTNIPLLVCVAVGLNAAFWFAAFKARDRERSEQDHHPAESS